MKRLHKQKWNWPVSLPLERSEAKSLPLPWWWERHENDWHTLCTCRQSSTRGWGGQRRRKGKRKEEEEKVKKERTSEYEIDCNYISRYPEWQSRNKSSIKASLEGQSGGRKEKKASGFSSQSVLCLLAMKLPSSSFVHLLPSPSQVFLFLRLQLKAEAETEVLSL